MSLCSLHYMSVLRQVFLYVICNVFFFISFYFIRCHFVENDLVSVFVPQMQDKSNQKVINQQKGPCLQTKNY